MADSKVHFFDVDHTITRHSTGSRFLMEGIKRKEFPASILLSFPIAYLNYRFGSINRFFKKNEIPIFKGKLKKDLDILAENCFHSRIKKDIFPGILNLIKELQSSGYEIILATSTLEVIIKPLADYLGVKEYIATSFEYDDGVCTGRFKGYPGIGPEKRKRVIEYAKNRNLSLKNCAFYSDSIHDLPLFKEVGIPIAVNPDFRLKKHALSDGWQIRRFF